jgi:restriction system protein
MTEPTLADFGLTVEDLRRADVFTRWLVLFALALSCATLVPASLFSFEQFRFGPFVAVFQVWIWIVLFVPFMPPWGAIIFYRGLRRFASSRWPFYDAVPRYREACKEYGEWIKRNRESFWTSLTPRQFEVELAALFQLQGFDAEVTPRSNDAGVDIWLSKDNKKVAVQCKAQRQAIGPGAVRELYGALWDFGAYRAILASLSGFTNGAREFVQDKPIQLLDLKGILEMRFRVVDKET